MKTLFYNLIIVLCLFSCRKDENSDVAPGDASIAKYLFDTVKDEVRRQLNSKGMDDFFRHAMATDFEIFR